MPISLLFSEEKTQSSRHGLENWVPCSTQLEPERKKKIPGPRPLRVIKKISLFRCRILIQITQSAIEFSKISENYCLIIMYESYLYVCFGKKIDNHFLKTGNMTSSLITRTIIVIFFFYRSQSLISNIIQENVWHKILVPKYLSTKNVAKFLTKVYGQHCK